MTAGLKPYPAYKDSGAEWLGDIPSAWSVLPGRACYRERNVPNLRLVETSVLSLSFGRIVVKPEEKLHGLVPSSFETYQIIDPGDIIVRPTDLQNDWNSLRFGLSAHRGIITSAYMCLRTTDAMTREFGHLLLHAYDLKKVFYGLGSGLRQNLDWRDFKYLPCVVPSHGEQAAIVRFLNHMDRRVRRFIRDKKKLIKLLEEQKRAIIDWVATGKIDPRTGKPYAVYQNSGIEWLGDVPGGWRVVRLKSLVSRVTSGSRGWSDFAADTGVLFIRVGNLTRASIGLDLDDVVRLRLPQSVLTGEGTRTRVQAHDILLSITAYIGSVAVVPDGLEEAYVSQHVACCRPRAAGADPKWTAYVLLSSVGQIHGQLSMYGGTKQGLSLDDVKNYVVVVPPADEQRLLVEWIEDACANVDAAITEARQAVTLVREYFIRLTADVVTGKLDVSEAAASIPDEAGDLEPIDDADVCVEGNEADEIGDAAAALEEVEA